jgi:hypothetical protein
VNNNPINGIAKNDYEMRVIKIVKESTLPATRGSQQEVVDGKKGQNTKTLCRSDQI